MNSELQEQNHHLQIHDNNQTPNKKHLEIKVAKYASSGKSKMNVDVVHASR